jgi:riboflavin biosynthesis pyrimidine reductase
MIDRLMPGPVTGATDRQLLNWYTHPAATGSRVSFNFVSSLDGAAALNGRSGGLGNAADRRIMLLLRRTADVLLLGAGTVRAEGYSGDLIGSDGVQWRESQGRSARPSLAVVSGSLRLDPDLPFFTAALERPLVVTTHEANRVRRRALEKVADVVTCGQRRLDVDLLIQELKRRGHFGYTPREGPTCSERSSTPGAWMSFACRSALCSQEDRALVSPPVARKICTLRDSAFSTCSAAGTCCSSATWPGKHPSTNERSVVSPWRNRANPPRNGRRRTHPGGSQHQDRRGQGDGSGHR